MRKQRKATVATPQALPVIRPQVAGIDIGSTQHWVCGPARADGALNVQRFGTTTDQLHALAAWLVAQQVESVAMESTSVYWIPVYEVLEARGLEVLLVNARQLHNVPGRKTDVNDCQWIQLLHSCGLLRGSFRPSDAIVRVRALRRQVTNLAGERTRCVQWMQKALDQMNVQVHRAVADLTGSTGLAIVRAIVAGERDPAQRAAHRDPRCRKSVAEIARYLTGTWRDEHLFTLASALRVFDMVAQEIAQFETRMRAEFEALQPPERRAAPVPPHPNAAKARTLRARGGEPVRTALWRVAGVDLTRIDGVSAGVAQLVLTEVGPTLTAFRSAAAFVSWLRLCPRTPISGGKPLAKRRNGRGANRLASALRMAATGLQHSPTALGAAYRRLARRKAGAVAVFAIARELAKLIYRMLRFGQDYVDVGVQAYEARFQVRRLASLTEAARSLGFTLVAQAPEPVMA